MNVATELINGQPADRSGAVFSFDPIGRFVILAIDSDVHCAWFTNPSINL
jgi:hypothetical protein